MALIGYGELIIIKHNEQWISAYGHNRKRLVNEGQTVKANQPIAEMGRVLYFEIRYNGKPVDPLVYLPRNNTPPAIPSKPVQTSIVLLESAICGVVLSNTITALDSDESLLFPINNDTPVL